MKSFSVGIISSLLFASVTWAQPHIGLIYSSSDAAVGKKFVATVSEDFNESTWEAFVVFGEENDNLEKQSFPTDLGFYLYPKSETRGYNDSYAMEALGTTREQFVLKLSPRQGLGAVESATFSLDDSAEARAMGQKLLASVIREKDELSRLTPQTLGDFKRKLNDYRFFGFSLIGPFPTYDLQIDGSLKVGSPSADLALAVVKEDGSDLISQIILKKGDKFFPNQSAAQEALAKVREKNELAENDSRVEFAEYGTYTYIKNQDFSFLESSMKTASNNFVRYEIVRITGQWCEGNGFEEADHTFILTDGTIVSYQVSTECD